MWLSRICPIMADRDTSHAWDNEALRCTVCGVGFDKGAAFYPCIGSAPFVTDVEAPMERKVDWFALNRSSG